MSSSAQKRDMKELIDVGEKLFRPPSATNELLMLLERAEDVLYKVGQQPPKSSRVALIPLMKALIADDLLRNRDVNIQISVACCFNELTRITAPCCTYNDSLMKEFFQLFNPVLKHLSEHTGRNYDRAVRMLETMAKLKSCLILLDLDCETMIIEMVQLFLDTIRSDHPIIIFKHMQTIIRMVVQESDDISFDLLRPILDSVKMENKNISQMSWELGNIVFEKCSNKLRNPLKEAVKAMNLDMDDYAEIVSFICQQTSVNKDGSTDGVSKSHEDPSHETEDCMQNSVNCDQTIFDVEHSSEILKPSQQIVNLKSCSANEVEDISGRESGSFQRKRGRKPSLRNAEGGNVSEYQEKDTDASVDEGGVQKRGGKKQKKGMINQKSVPESSAMLREKLFQTKVKKGGSSVTKKTGMKIMDGSNSIPDKTSEKILGGANPRGEATWPYLVMHNNEKAKKEIFFKIHESSNRRKGARRSLLCSGEELVDLRVKVWWPDDEKYYYGTVVSFDHSTNKHKVLYDDNDTEILSMDEEIWELVDDLNSIKQFSPTPTKKSIESVNKKAKTIQIPPMKHSVSSSYKRFKGEKGGAITTGEAVSPIVFLNRDESNHETSKSTVRLEKGAVIEATLADTEPSDSIHFDKTKE